jgi:hypothetical protein
MFACYYADDKQLQLMPAKIRQILEAYPPALTSPDNDGEIPADYLKGPRFDACLAALRAPVSPSGSEMSGLANMTEPTAETAAEPEPPMIITPDAATAASAAMTRVNLKARGAHVVLSGLNASRKLNGKRGEVKRPADGEDPDSKATVLLLAEEEGGGTVHVRERCILAVCANEECPLDGPGAEGAKLLQCLGCKGSSYCSLACQTAAWKGGHKGRCIEEQQRTRD